MIEIKATELKENLILNQNQMPLIICSDSNIIRNKLTEKGFQELNINKYLSKALLNYETSERVDFVEKELRKLLKSDIPLQVENFEMLFDPRYKIDVLKVFCDGARNNSLAVFWPGRYVDGKLTYAEPQNEDYHEYNCNAYQIIIVK